MLEGMAYPTWVRESPSIFAYTMILSLHAMGLATLVGLHTVVCLRLLGVLKELPLSQVRKVYPMMYLGMWVNIFSGLSLLWANLSGMLTNPAFLFKISFIILGIIFLQRMKSRVFSDAALAVNATPTSEARKLAWVSLFCWLGATVSGRLTAYPGFVSSLFGS
jgi:hypothetical protein